MACACSRKLKRSVFEDYIKNHSCLRWSRDVWLR